MLHPDISHHHPVTNWNKFLSQCDFVISKATEGTSYVDSTLKTFIKQCETHKKPYWLYAFLDKGNELKQAQFLVKTCKPLVGKYFVGYCLDVEAKNDPSNVREALDYIKKESSKTMIYTMYAEYSKYASVISSRGANCAWWEARYGANNGKDTSSKYPCHKDVDLHQYTSNGTVSGITGSIDLNRLTGSLPASFFTNGGSSKSSTGTSKTPHSGTALKYSKTVETYQKAYNKYFEIKLSVDGLKGEKTKASFARALLEYVKGKDFDYRTELVKIVQKAVGVTADGKYGPSTADAVKAFQKKNSLKVDGIVGKDTWNKIVK